MESDRGNRDYPDWFLYQYAAGEKIIKEEKPVQAVKTV